MTELFYWMLNMSVAGTAVALIVFALRKIKGIPRRFICFLWLLPLVRLCVPFGLPSRYSLLNLVARFTTKSVPAESTPEFLPQMYFTNYIMAVNQYGIGGEAGEAADESAFTFKTELLNRLFSTGAVIWAVIFAAAILTASILYLLTKAELKDAVRLRDNIYVSEKITSPALYGIIKPKIVVPPGIPEDTLLYIEAHENAHRRRGDNITRMIALAAACLHWFNPLAWIMLKCWLEDTELACDEAAIHKLGPHRRKAYASALLSCAESRTLFAPAFSPSFGGAKIRLRIESILSYRKITAASAFAFMILLAALAVTLLTNAN